VHGSYCPTDRDRPARSRIGLPLDQICRHATLFQGLGKGEAGDTAADDQDPHRLLLLGRMTVIFSTGFRCQ
jgi:hypothetical protein